MPESFILAHHNENAYLTVVDNWHQNPSQLILDRKIFYFRKGAFDNITASYRRFPLSIIETDNKSEILQLDL